MTYIDLEKMYQNVTTFLHSLGFSNVLYSVSWDTTKKSGKVTVSALRNQNTFIFLLNYWIYEDRVSFNLLLNEQEIYRNVIALE